MNTAGPFSEEEKNPLQSIEAWEDDVLVRYPEAEQPAKSKEEYRNYDNPQRDTVREFYRLNHKYQTCDFVMEKKREFLQFSRKEMPVWSAMEFLNTLVDDSDPDIELDQLQHLLQTAEAIRADGHPDWFILTGFIHDMGKVL
ncbi:MAG TPA: inositol oxygenase family protein, partial [Anseongella sp.]|nr:inositol oxygenase family protein [Anseongella sp.]